MIQVCHSSISMLHRQQIHIGPVLELLWSAAAHHDAVGKAPDIFLMRSSDSDE